MSDSVQAVDQVAREVEQTIKRYRDRERELHAEIVRITARFDERVRASMEELAQHVAAVDALSLERGSEAQLRRKALGTFESSRLGTFQTLLDLPFS